MKSAIVESYGRAPRYGQFEDPVAQAGQQLVAVRAAALTPLTKSIAAGKHCSSGNSFPFVPGVDGVGRLEDGQRVCFVFPAVPYGSMAERTVMQSSMCVALPDELDDLTAAVGANPGMSSWAASTERAGFAAGETVLINGATGAAGRLAIQISKFLGAKTVIATGRNQGSVAPLAELGADLSIPLDQEPEKLTESFRRTIKEHRVSVIIDYLWGASAQSIINAVTGHGSVEGEPPIRFVQIGSITGEAIPLSAAALRSSGLKLMGSGLGSVSYAGLIRSISGLMGAIVPGRFRIEAEPVLLSAVETAWNREASGRFVFIVEA
jgi:NADPH:quinone reductase-like Zn-dependent oxidoreductase